jgi:hypothetical protein
MELRMALISHNGPPVLGAALENIARYAIKRESPPIAVEPDVLNK